MKHKFNFLFVLLCMLICSIGAYADDEVKWDSVSTASEFYSKIKANHSANIKLIADIDLLKASGDDGCIFNFEFKGKINGKYINSKGQEDYHKIMNGDSLLLFNKLTNAEISEIVIQDWIFEAWDTGSGCICPNAKNCTFRNIFLSNVDGSAECDGIDYDYVGGMVGKAEGCTFENIIAMDVDIFTDGYMAGCIVGKATDNCKFTNILVNMLCSVWADGNTEWSNVKDAAYAGGVCGYSEDCSFKSCNVMGLVSGNDDRIGGIVGFGKSTSIIDCNNYSIVTHLSDENYYTVRDKITAYCASKVGVSRTSEELYAMGSFATLLTAWVAYGSTMMIIELIGAQFLGLCTGGTFFLLEALILPEIIYMAQDPDEVGGIAGHLQESSSAIGCTNNGFVCTSDAYAGGIVGYLKSSSVIDCCNNSIVNGQQQTGGIVGMNDNGKIISCLNIGSLAIYEESYSGREIQGTSDGSVTVKGNCYTSSQDGTGTSQKAVSQQSLASGSVAAYLNANTTQSEKRWTQMIGTDFYPSPTAVTKDTTAITESDIDATVSYLHQVSNLGEFLSAVSNPAVNVELTGDIDMEKSSYIAICGTTPFCGAIYGNGHTIKNNAMSATELSDWDTDNDNQALFSSAKNAIFANIILDNFKMTQYEGSQFVDSKHTEAFLVGTSNNCRYSNITVRNSSITRDDSYLAEVGGIVSISNNDSISNCTMESTCKLQGFSGWKCTDTNVGGIAAKAYGTVFTQCWNAASIWADDNQEGGIVAYASGCKIDRCLNTRGITAQENVGGICGNGYNTVITRCVNTSWISDDDNTREDKRAGIVGYLHGSGASISQCLNFGPINYADDDCGALEGCAKDGAKSAKNTNSFYYCGYNNGHVDNQYEYSDASIFRIAKVKSGEFAYKSTIDQVEGADKWLYQDIDNNTFCTNYPVPIPAAGTVYSNILCDGTQSYSNNYSSTAAHTAVDDGFGVCSICGNVLKDNAPASITISDVADLIKVSKAVERGVDYSNTTITLANDIDLDGYSFTPIGLNSSTPFKGTFDGQGHRIKNMTLSYAQGGVGFFGYVTGANTAIKNVIIDSSCSVTSTSGVGIAGLIGGVTSTSGSTCNITIENCGNEADVTGVENVAGLLGGVYNNDATVVNINNCYNTGSISGNTYSASASIVGWTYKHTNIRNTYNSGTVGGTNNWLTFACTMASGFNGTIENCYTTVTGDKTSNVTKISSDDVTYGTLCNKLNTNHGTYSSWAQNIESDTHPVFGDGSVTFSRSSADKWTTVVLPFDVKISDTEQYMFYSITAVADSALSLSRMSGTLSAGTPAIVYMDETAKDSTNNYVLSLASSGNISSTINNPAAVGGLTLTGVYKKTAITNVSGYKLVGDYFYNLAANDSAKTIYCEPYTAYLAGTLDNNAEKLTMLSDIVEISTPDELMAFSNAVNSGTDYSKSIVILNNDMDMSGCEFTPIGNDTHPFKGIFNGNCHRIKNLTINSTQARTGFFGTVAGANTFIKNLIIDSSCSVTSSACGTAGVVGGLQASTYATCNVSIINCGNEANITGVGNVAGVLGGVYANNSSVLTINNCYNTGAITGTKESATICGYARRNYTITNTYNTGSLTGAESGKAFYRYASGGTQYVANCYDINGAQGDGVAQLSSDDAALGVLCQKLNAGNSSNSSSNGSSSNAKAINATMSEVTTATTATTNAFGEIVLGNSVWAQNIANDSIPTFGEGGLTYTRKSAFRFGAIVLPFDVAIYNSNPYEFYILSLVSSGDTIVVRKMTEGVLAAGTPAFLVMKEEAKDAETNTFGLSLAAAPDANTTTTVDNSLSVGGLTLKGVFHATDITDEAGYVAYSDTVVSISTLAEKVGNIICPAFNAYISGSLSINPLSLTVLFDLGNNDDPTAIDVITNSLGESDKQVFDLCGRRTAGFQRGINVVKYGNGVTRKVIIR